MSSSDRPIDNTLLDRYIAGECTLSEGRRVAAWIAAHPAMGDVVAQLRMGNVPGRVDAELDWGRVRKIVERIEDDAPRVFARHVPVGVSAHRSEDGMTRVFKTQPPRWSVWSAAMVLGLGFVVLFLGWHVKAHHGQDRQMAVSVYTTGNGERATITLPDSGTVSLNVASRLEVPVDYMTGNHTVRLIGEGLFTVSHHEGAPFVVLTGTTATRVLGTSFVVRHYAADTATTVAVREGKVAVGTTVVTAAREVEVGLTGTPHTRPSDGSQFTFATGLLTIDGLPLPAALLELDRWYNADIRLGDPALATHFVKGMIAAGSLADLQAMLEETFDVRVVRDGRVLTLYPKR